jgi:hypothetical protein
MNVKFKSRASALRAQLQKLELHRKLFHVCTFLSGIRQPEKPIRDYRRGSKAFAIPEP